MSNPTDTVWLYTRAEKALFGSLTEQQWEILDQWSQEHTFMDQFMASLTEAQESLALIWAQRLVALIEAIILHKVKLAQEIREAADTRAITSTSA